jgi:uncharacterized membrane protein
MTKQYHDIHPVIRPYVARLIYDMLQVGRGVILSKIPGAVVRTLASLVLDYVSRLVWEQVEKEQAQTGQEFLIQDLSGYMAVQVKDRAISILQDEELENRVVASLPRLLRGILRPVVRDVLRNARATISID